MKDIIKFTDIKESGGILRIDSRLIAERLGIAHDNFLQTLEKHKADIEKELGSFLFETGTIGFMRSDGTKGASVYKYSLLNEEQATVLMTLSRNTPQVVALKIALVKAFSEARKALAAKQRIHQLLIEEQTHRETQVRNSKRVNALTMRVGGVQGIKIYNRENCKAHCGLTPTQVKAIGKNRGLKSAQRSSAKEVFRHEAPHIAAAMSLTDAMMVRGLPQQTAFEIGKESQSLFQKMLKHGLSPEQLDI